VITYVDTSILMKLLIDDERFRAESERLWVESGYTVCAEIGYAEARAALAALQRNKRLTAAGLRTAKDGLELLWEQLTVVVVDSDLVRAAGDLAEDDALRGYDAVHLAAAIAGQVTVVASADPQLIEAARRRGFAVAEPSERDGSDVRRWSPPISDRPAR
jgi:predicted nucleic acid-binding protein